jgi:hypothetical protein
VQLGISIAPKRVEAMTQIATVITNHPGRKIPVLKFNPKPFAGAIGFVRYVAPDSEMQIGQSFAPKFWERKVKIRGTWDGKPLPGQFLRDNTGPIQEWKSLEHCKPGARSLKLPNGSGWVHTHNSKGNRIIEWTNRDRRDHLTAIPPEVWQHTSWEQIHENQRQQEIQQQLQERVAKIEGQMAKDVQDTYWTIGSTKQKELWVQKLENAADNNEPLFITGKTLNEAEEEIRYWLTYINDICRIASFFHADGLLDTVSEKTGKQKKLYDYMEDMFADNNLPEIEVSVHAGIIGLCTSANAK